MQGGASGSDQNGLHNKQGKPERIESVKMVNGFDTINKMAANKSGSLETFSMVLFFYCLEKGRRKSDVCQGGFACL